MVSDGDEALARKAGLAAKLEVARRAAKRTAVLLGLLTESLYWGSVGMGGVATTLGLLGSKRLGVPDGTLEPWISIFAAASTGGVILLKQARLRVKTAIWFDFYAYLETLQVRLEFRLPSPPTLDSVSSVANAYELERMRVQQRMKDVDGEMDSKMRGGHDRGPSS